MNERPRNPSDGRAWTALVLVTNDLRFFSVVNQLASSVVNEGLRTLIEVCDGAHPIYLRCNDPARAQIETHSGHSFLYNRRSAAGPAAIEIDLAETAFASP
jgi:hypothetical protein